MIIDKLIKKLNKEDFDIDEKNRNILLTNKGIDSIEKIFSEVGILKNNNFYDPDNLHLVLQSLIIRLSRLLLFFLKRLSNDKENWNTTSYMDSK